MRVEKDSFTTSGMIAKTETAEWDPVIGSLLTAI